MTGASPTEPGERHGEGGRVRYGQLVVAVAFAALPLFGVLVLGWDAIAVVTYYWAYNVAILVTQPWFIWRAGRLQSEAIGSGDPGATTAPRPGMTPVEHSPAPPHQPHPTPHPTPLQPPPAAGAPASPAAGGVHGAPIVLGPLGMSLFTAAFFILHFGGFTAAHGVLLQRMELLALGSVPLFVVAQVVRRLVVERHSETTRAMEQSFPSHVYGRVVALQLAILGTAAVVGTRGGANSAVAVAVICAVGIIVELLPLRSRLIGRMT
jgi:hypothetical protein